MRCLPALLVLSAALAGAGCNAFVDEDLDRLIGDAEASGLSACRTVPVGAKACGGPTDYAVYSAEASEAAAIVQTAEEITRMDEQANREFGLGSDCAVTPEPAVVWVGGQCRAQ